MTVMAVVGSKGRQAIVTRLGFRSVAVMGLALTGGPNRLLTLTERFQAAFTAAIVFQAVGLACAILLLGKVAAPPPLVPETAAAPDVLLRHPAQYLAAHRCFPCKADSRFSSKAAIPGVLVTSGRQAIYVLDNHDHRVEVNL